MPEILQYPPAGTGQGFRDPRKLLAFLLKNVQSPADHVYDEKGKTLHDAWCIRFAQEIVLAEHNFSDEDFIIFLKGILATNLPIKNFQRKIVISKLKRRKAYEDMAGQ